MMLHRRLVGMGALVDDQVAATLLSFQAGLAFEAERGTIPDPSVVRDSMLSETSNTCAISFNPNIDCPHGVPTAGIDAAIATYTQNVADAKARAAAYFAANNITPPPPPAPMAVAVAPTTAAYYPQATQLTPAQILPAVSPTPAIASQGSQTSQQSQSQQSQPSQFSLTTISTWLQGSMFGGIPNWVLVGAAIGAAWYFGKKR